MYYYPYKEGNETLPIPSSTHCNYENPILVEEEPDQEMPEEQTQTVSLSERNPGFEVFWNGRLLPKEHIRLDQYVQSCSSVFVCVLTHLFVHTCNRWASTKRIASIPEDQYKRIKGMIFVDQHFPVTATKVCANWFKYCECVLLNCSFSSLALIETRLCTRSRYAEI